MTSDGVQTYKSKESKLVAASPENSSNNLIGLLPLSALDHLKDAEVNDPTTSRMLDDTIQDISQTDQQEMTFRSLKSLKSHGTSFSKGNNT